MGDIGRRIRMLICPLCQKTKCWIYGMIQECRESVNNTKKSRPINVYEATGSIRKIIVKYKDRFTNCRDLEETLDFNYDSLDKPINDRVVYMQGWQRRKPKEVRRIAEEIWAEQLNESKKIIDRLEIDLHKKMVGKDA